MRLSRIVPIVLVAAACSEAPSALTGPAAARSGAPRADDVYYEAVGPAVYPSTLTRSTGLVGFAVPLFGGTTLTNVKVGMVAPTDTVPAPAPPAPGLFTAYLRTHGAGALLAIFYDAGMVAPTDTVPGPGPAPLRSTYYSTANGVPYALVFVTMKTLQKQGYTAGTPAFILTYQLTYKGGQTSVVTDTVPAPNPPTPGV